MMTMGLNWRRELQTCNPDSSSQLRRQPSKLPAQHSNGATLKGPFSAVPTKTCSTLTTVCLSQLDEICLFVHSNLRISVAFRGKLAEQVGGVFAILTIKANSTNDEKTSMKMDQL